MATSQALLLERESELALLADLVGAAGAGARVALIEGPAGIGKTQLVAYTRRLGADAGLRVLSARGGELEREFAFGVVRQLFEPLVAGGGLPEGALDGAASTAASVFGSVDHEGADGDTSFAVLHGLYWLTINVASEQPVLLAIDDLHWCDRASLRYLAYLVRRLEGLPVAVVCGLRPSEPGVDELLLAEIASDPLSLPIRPGALSRAAVATLAQGRLGAQADAAFIDACHDATGGNPLLLSELFKALAAEGVSPTAAGVGLVRELGPRAASRAVLLRLGRLPAEARAAAQALAILGDGADLAVIAALGSLDREVALQGIEALARVEVVRAEPPLGFVHPLVAAAVYHDMPLGERARQHERAAELLAELHAPAEQIAAHLLPLPPAGRDRGVRVLRDAAGVAVAKGAPESAIAYLRRALAEPPPSSDRGRVLFDLGQAEAMVHGPSSLEPLREAYEVLDDPVLKAVAAHVLGQMLLFVGHPEQVLGVVRRARAELPEELDELARVLEAFELMGVYFGLGSPEAFARLEELRSLPLGTTLGSKLLAAATSSTWAYAGGSAEDCCGLSLAALADGELHRAEHALYATTASIPLIIGDRDEALAHLEAMLAEAHRAGSGFSAPGITMFLAWAAARRGELIDAEETFRGLFHDFERFAFGPMIESWASAQLASVLTGRGKLAEARTLIEGSRRSSQEGDSGLLLLRHGRLQLDVAAGRLEDAIETAAEIERHHPEIVNPAFVPWRSLQAVALGRLGRPEEALAIAAEEVERARRWGAPWGLGHTLRTLGSIQGEQGLDTLREAVAVLDGSPARLELAHALAALGARLRRDRQPTEAREPLRRALELAELSGADDLAEDVRSEIYATGARPRTTALAGVGALTASERRVAQLAAEGKSNRDIAQALFVTPKTVEVHLSSTYRKLSISSRRELAGAMAEA